jgi:hypothetical protein
MGKSKYKPPLKFIARMFRVSEDMSLARRLMRSAGWGSCELPEPADEGIGAKPP